jgi:hypothetical protein
VLLGEMVAAHTATLLRAQQLASPVLESDPAAALVSARMAVGRHRARVREGRLRARREIPSPR